MQKKAKQLLLKDYRPMVSKYIYDYGKIKSKDNNRITKKECYCFNRTVRLKNIAYFNKTLHESLLYFLDKNNISKNDLRLLLGTTLTGLDVLFNREKFTKYLDFKFVYDICDIMEIGIIDVLEKMEGKFTKNI